MKEVKIKRGGKTYHQFLVGDAQLSIAERLGIPQDVYIQELVKAELKEREEKEEAKKLNEHNLT